MMAPYHAGFADLVKKLSGWIDLSPEKAVGFIADAGLTEKPVHNWPGISPYVIPSVLWSLYSFLKYPDSYRDAVSLSIQVGGDVDTTGAMTGAISGACLGLEALPRHLAEQVNDNSTWDFDELIKLSNRAFDLVHNET